MDRKTVVAMKGVMAVFAIGVLGSVVFAEEPPKRILVDADPEATEALLAKLREARLNKGGLDFAEAPLEEVVDFLRAEYELPIHINRSSIEELGLGLDEPITVNLRDVKLDVALQMMLQPLELIHSVQNGVVTIGSHDEMATRLSIVIYPVSELLLEGDYNVLIDTITATIAVDTWAENGGGEAEIRPYPQRGALVVSQTGDVHREIVNLLTSLGKLPIDPNAKPVEVRASLGGGSGCGGGGGGGGFGFGSGSFRVSDEQPVD